MKTIHKVVLALVSSFANGTSNPAPQGNRALEKIDALTHGYSPRPKQENRNPETPQKRPLFQKIKEAWMNPKETAATIGVGITYGIVIGALLLLPFPPKSIQAQSTPQTLPRPKTPKILEVHVDGLNPLVSGRGRFDISVVTDSEPAWTYYKWCWSGVYYSRSEGARYIDVLKLWETILITLLTGIIGMEDTGGIISDTRTTARLSATATADTSPIPVSKFGQIWNST